MNKISSHYQLVKIVRVAKGHYTVKNTAGLTLSFKRLHDAQVFVICNWSVELMEAQWAA